MHTEHKVIGEKKRFVTVFPDIENIHLIKDVGMYPFSMYKYCGYDSGIVIKSDREYTYLESEVKGLKGYRLPMLFKNNDLNCLVWLLLNAKKIDVLNLFHQIKHTRISIALYKRLNRKGKVYVHLDADGTEYEGYTLGLQGKTLKKKIKRMIYYHIFYPAWIRKDIYWGVQNKRAQKSILGKFPYDNVQYMPDGFNNELESKIDYSEKENIILTVGRIGSKQKRTDILLDGFKEACKEIETSWILKVVGPIEQEFKKKIDLFMNENPELKDRIVFTGAIYNREELLKQYRKSKIFCLTSDYESFGIVLVEALSMGCTLISTDFAAAYDILDNQSNGRLFRVGNTIEFTKCLTQIANNKEYMKAICEKGQVYAIENYSYRNIANKLHRWIGTI